MRCLDRQQEPGEGLEASLMQNKTLVAGGGTGKQQPKAAATVDGQIRSRQCNEITRRARRKKVRAEVSLPVGAKPRLGC